MYFWNDLCLWRADALLANRDHKSAARWINRSLWLRRDVDARTCLMKLRVARRSRDFPEVERLLRQAAERNVPLREIQRERWLAMAQANQFTQMETYWSELLSDPRDDGPEIARSYYAWAILHHKLSIAEKTLRLWHDDYPRDPEPVALLGRFYESHANWEGAEDAYRRASKLAPGNDDYQLSYANALRSRLKTKEAIAIYQDYLRRHPEELVAMRGLAQCATTDGDLDTAVKCLKIVVQNQPDDVMTQKIYGETLLSAGHASEAAEVLEKAHQTVPEYANLAYSLARALKACGSAEKAEPLFAFVAESRPELDRLFSLEQQLQKQPDNLELRMGIAGITAKYISRRDAVRWYQNLLSIAPNYSPAQKALDELNRQTSDPSLATDHTRGNHRPDRTESTFNSTQIVAPSADGVRSPGLTHFVDVAEMSGVSWIGHNGEEAGLFAILETFGTGCALDDYDRDGTLDLFFAGGGRFGPHQEILPLPIALYRQASEWAFVPVTTAAGLEPVLHYHHGIWTADIDEDGFSDLLITGWGGLQLFHNQGDGTFVDLTQASGLTDTMWSLAAGWADLNHDHVLDLFVGHYVDWSFQNNPVCIDARLDQRIICDPTRFQGLPCTVYLSNADGTYRDASREMGIREVGKTLGVVIADLNGDRQPDIYVANDTAPNQLYESQPSGGYREVGIENGVALGEAAVADGSMGVDIGDLDGDGQLDLWVSNFERETFALYRNLGNDMFTHASLAFGVSAVGSEAVGFGTVILDADGDGWPDIFCTNGHVLAPNSSVERRQFPYLFWNDHGRRLRNIAQQSGDYMRHRHLGRGAAVGDIDNNGTPDLVVTHSNEPVALLRNDSAIPNWLSVRLVGRTSPRSGIGAQVIVNAGQHRQIGIVKGGGSYLSTSESTLLFGLGSATAIDSIQVEWPSGKTTTLNNIASCQRLILIEDSR